MNLLFTHLFDEDVLKKLREKWIKLYDFNFIDNEIIGKLLNLKKNLKDLLSFINKKAMANNFQLEAKELSTPHSERSVSSAAKKTKTKPEEEKKILIKSKSARKITIPVPFKLSQNQPRVLQEPKAISNEIKFIPLPLANYKKTSLKDIRDKRNENLQLIKKNIMERNAKDKGFDLKTDRRPSNLEKVREELENKIKATLQFNNKYITQMKDFQKYEANIKYNEAAIIKEQYLIEKKIKKEEAALNKILIEKKDSKEFDRWQNEMKIKDNILKVQEIEKRKLELDLNREVASTYMQRRVQKNQLKAAEHKQQEIQNMKKKAEEKEEDIKNKKEVIKEINKNLENIMKQKLQKMKYNRQLYKKLKNELNELSLIAHEEKKIYLDGRDDLIRQIRELEKLPIRRTMGFDPTETPGYGLLEEMSLVELRERLAIQKRMLADEIRSKKEENKIRMLERADDLINKAQMIQENRDKLRNQKEIERKAKKDEKLAEAERTRIAREKSLLEVKQIIENKKKKLKKEDEIFQKRIREIKLQRQFLQLGRDAVEYKQFKQIEDGMENKINDRQNQDLINQLNVEKIKWVGVTMRYRDAKKFNQYTKDLLNNYNDAYALSSTLNRMINEEDEMYKKALYDRERSLNIYYEEDFKERNKYSFHLKQEAMKKTLKKNKSAISFRNTPNHLRRKNLNLDNTNINEKNQDEKNKEEEKVKEESDNDDEPNAIKDKLQNEEILSKNKPTP